MAALYPPPATPTSIKRPDNGTGPWALQKALASYGERLTVDGVFGPQTEASVKRYQSTNGLTPDGKAGPATQARLAKSLILEADPEGKCPDGLLRGIIEGESANYVAAVNWNSPGGVDCGYTQRRVYEPITEEATARAFDSKYQIRLLRNQLVERKASYFGKPAVVSHRRAWELAVLHHNYPAAAVRFSTTWERDLTSYWTTPQKWVVAIGARFSDGTPVQTPLQWTVFYTQKMCRYVKWS